MDHGLRSTAPNNHNFCSSIDVDDNEDRNDKSRRRGNYKPKTVVSAICQRNKILKKTSDGKLIAVQRCSKLKSSNLNPQSEADRFDDNDFPDDTPEKVYSQTSLDGQPQTRMKKSKPSSVLQADRMPKKKQKHQGSSASSEFSEKTELQKMMDMIMQMSQQQQQMSQRMSQVEQMSQ